MAVREPRPWEGGVEGLRCQEGRWQGHGPLWGGGAYKGSGGGVQGLWFGEGRWYVGCRKGAAKDKIVEVLCRGPRASVPGG